MKVIGVTILIAFATCAVKAQDTKSTFASDFKKVANVYIDNLKPTSKGLRKTNILMLKERRP